MVKPAALDPKEASSFLLDALQAAHDREPFVGGLFNAYEPALHYELFNAALARGLDDTWQEEALGRGQTTCDLVFPLVGDDRLWVEAKMWWFLFEAYASSYVNYEKTRGWPLADWERLAHPPKGHHRALLLTRTWDNEAGLKKADEWLDGLTKMMIAAGASSPVSRSLKSRTYAGPHRHTRYGDVILWSSTID
jgi:hypothetical protein